MLDGAFTRGTTPVQIFELPDGIEKSDLADYTITYRQKKNIVFTKRKEDTTELPNVDMSKNIAIILSQTDTLMFDPRINKVEVQIKAISQSGEVFIVSNYKLRLDNCFDEDEIGFS